MATTGGETPFPWLAEAKAAGWKVDVNLVCLGWPRDYVERMEALFPEVFTVRGHEYEFTHEGTGINLLGNYAKSLGEQRLAQRSGAVMCWGDALELRRKSGRVLVAAVR